MFKWIAAGVAALLSAGLAFAEPKGDAVIYTASRVVTMAGAGVAKPNAIVVQGDRIIAVGRRAQLVRTYPKALRDDRFSRKVIIPGLIDPHIHVVLGGLLYAQPFAAPWPTATPDGVSPGYPSRAAFLDRLREIVQRAPDDRAPVIVYGYHNLVQGDLDRTVLDAIAPQRPLIVWHYSGHDFYLNSAALALIGATPALKDKFHGVDVAANGELTGRLYEDAGLYAFQRLGASILDPAAVQRGTAHYFEIMRRAGVTTAAEMAYGAFGLDAEARIIGQNWSLEKSGFRLYLTPEYRAFERKFGDGDKAAAAIRALAAGEGSAPAPVLPSIKLFADGAFYSQTMRLSAPGYLAGQSKGSEGLWVVAPDRMAETMRPYMRAGLSVHIHSNGDAAQGATLAALATMRKEGLKQDFVIEHAGLFSPAEIAEAARLDVMISAASHYAFYLAHSYAEPLGAERRPWILPLGAFKRAGMVVALHSDAPLAPPQPLRAAGVQITRATREGAPYEPGQALSRTDALRAVTIDAARVLGLQSEIGSIEPGKRADFTILEANPLETPGARWADIGVWGVVLGGEVRPIAR